MVELGTSEENQKEESGEESEQQTGKDWNDKVQQMYSVVELSNSASPGTEQDDSSNSFSEEETFEDAVEGVPEHEDGK